MCVRWYRETSSSPSTSCVEARVANLSSCCVTCARGIIACRRLLRMRTSSESSREHVCWRSEHCEHPSLPRATRSARSHLILRWWQKSHDSRSTPLLSCISCRSQEDVRSPPRAVHVSAGVAAVVQGCQRIVAADERRWGGPGAISTVAESCPLFCRCSPWLTTPHTGHLPAHKLGSFSGSCTRLLRRKHGAYAASPQETQKIPPCRKNIISSLRSANDLSALLLAWSPPATKLS